MHELSIAQEIVATVRRHLPRETGRLVCCVSIRLGVLNHITPASLRFCFHAASRGTAVEGARLDIEETAGDEIRVVHFDVEDGEQP